MKRSILIILALIVSFAVLADGKKEAKKSTKMVNSKIKSDPAMSPIQPVPIISSKNDFKGTQEVERVYIGKSANIYSVLLEEQRGLDYNIELDMYSFTFRTDPATYPEALNSGNIITATSIDGGSNWSDTWLMNTEDPCRYPSGVVYNPEGNSDPSEAFAIAAGGVFNAAWTHNFFAHSKINGEDQDHIIVEVDASYSGSQIVRNGLQVCSDGYAHILGPKYLDEGGYSTEMNLNIWNAEFNGAGFDWDYVDVPVDLAYRTDGTTKNFWTFGSAWSNDGSIGYVWMIGITDDLDGESGYSPVVYYTTDQGESWDEVEVALEDNEVMAEYLWATDQFTGPMWPQCTELAGVVDMNNDLQLFTKATGTFSTHTDSVGYSYVGNLDYIFNIEVSTDGVQNVFFVDSLMSTDVAGANGLGGVEGWSTRLRASKTIDGDAIFAVWTDSDVEVSGEENLAPNIKAGGRLIDGDFGDFPVTNFTQDDLYAGFYFFINVGQFCKIENNYVQIPVTTTVSPSEFSSGTELTPVTHSYVKGIEFLWVEGIEDVNTKSNISVSQNNPNPFTGATTIEVSSKTVAPVMVEVSNIMGQTVYSINAGTINGIMKIQLDANDLESGVYFYTVRIGSESISRKMIIE